MRIRLIAALLCASPLFAGTVYWYNGDSDNYNNLLNEDTGASGTALVYDDFVVGAGGVTVTGVFSNDVIENAISSNNDPGVVTDANWEIRSGVSGGNGGTLVASGSGAATQTDTGLLSENFAVYNIDIEGLNVSLTPGTYWLAVIPDLGGNDNGYVATTSGANAIGTPQAQDGDSFFTSNVLSFNFLTAIDLIGGDPGDGGNADFSMGVETAPTPEPGTAALGAVAMLLAGLAAVTRRLRA